MPYEIKKTQIASRIEECQYAIGNEVQFTKFTSCIGIVGKCENMVIGMHLVIINKDDNKFNNQAADRAAKVTNGFERKVFGKIGFWKNNADTAIVSSFNKLMESLGNPETIEKDDGTYGARVEDGELKIFLSTN